MPALPEYKTRMLLANLGVPVVEGVFVTARLRPPDSIPRLPVYLKAQIAGITSRAARGLVRRADTSNDMESHLNELLAPGACGQVEGVLITTAVNLVGEYYAACTLDFGSAERLPGGILIFSQEGGSGIEERVTSLHKIPFSLLKLPMAADLVGKLGDADIPKTVGTFLESFIKTFARYKLTVLEANPLGVLENGDLIVIDCRAEFENQAVSEKDKVLFTSPPTGKEEMTRLERLVMKINEDDPAGTSFVRETRELAPEGSWRVATNLCGGGGKMFWEMTTGARKDIHSMNESDTSGGLSAFKSYRVLRAILEMNDSQVLLLTGSGMGFQNQYHLAAAVWKGLRESPTPLPALLRFGGTDEDKARALIERVAPTLPVPVKIFFPYVFPSAMADHIPAIAAVPHVEATPEPQPEEEPTFSVAMPPGDFFFYPDKWAACDAPPCVAVCPSGFLSWNSERCTIEPVEGAHCIGCLLCETVSLLEGNGELRIRLNMPKVDL